MLVCHRHLEVMAMDTLLHCSCDNMMLWDKGLKCIQFLDFAFDQVYQVNPNKN